MNNDEFREKLLDDISAASVAWEYIDKKAVYLEDVESKINAEEFKKKCRVEKYKGLTLALYFIGITFLLSLLCLVLYAFFENPVVFLLAPAASALTLYILSSRYKKKQVPVFEKSADKIISSLKNEQKEIIDEIEELNLQITGLFVSDMTDFGKEKYADQYEEYTKNGKIPEILRNPTALQYIFESINREKVQSLPAGLHHFEDMIKKLKETGGEENAELITSFENAEAIAYARAGIITHCTNVSKKTAEKTNKKE